MSDQPHITQRDLRGRSKEIMDTVAAGGSFIVTRGGHEIAELVPIKRRRRFVSREDFAAMSVGAPAINPDSFRADQEAALDDSLRGPYA